MDFLALEQSVWRRLQEETRPIAGGLVLKQDALEVDASFETLMRLQRDELASEVANILFS